MLEGAIAFHECIGLISPLEYEVAWIASKQASHQTDNSLVTINALAIPLVPESTR
jgi:hypothetical protein